MKNKVLKAALLGCAIALVELSYQPDLTAQIRTTDLPEAGFKERIEKAVNDIRIIDTHEHLRTEPGIMDDSDFDFMHLFQQYINYDLISAGMPRDLWESVNDKSYSLKDRWEMFKPFWYSTRATGYGRVPLIIANDLYDIPDINDDTYQELSKRINDSMKWGWYKHVLKDKAKIDLSILDRGHQQFDKDFYVHVERFDDFIYLFSDSEIKGLGQIHGVEIESLDDFLHALEKAFQAGLDREMVGVKSALAYNRIIQYEDVSKERAEEVFTQIVSRDSTQSRLNFDSVKPLQDYMMHRVLDLADKNDLPVQVHTGLHAGNGNVITNSKPTHLNNLFHEYPDVKFCIFHSSYPYGGELSVLAKNFPNVFIDMCWTYVISPSYSERYLHEWIETVPANKIMAFGGDYITVEDVYAHSVMARRVVAKVLIEKVASAYITEEEAIDIATRIFRENAMEIFRLDDKSHDGPGLLPIPHYSAGIQGNASVAHDGGLEWVAGVQNIQVTRSVPSNPALGDGGAYTIRHHPFIAYWDGYFWVYHIANNSVTRDQSMQEGRLQWSEDGLNWDQENSSAIFPEGRCTHQRMAFYTASNGVFLVITWMSTGEGDRGTVGSRLVRRVHGPNNYGDIHVIRHNKRGAYAAYPFYTASSDSEFKDACDELLANKLYRQQWQEEDIDEDYYVVNGTPDGKNQAKAFAWYTRPNGQIIGLLKGLYVATAMNWDFGKIHMVNDSAHYDDGKLTHYNLFGLHGSSKSWGQRISDGNYAIAGNSAGELFKRWPLVLTTSEHGLDFNTPYAVVAGDFGPQRYPQPDYDNKDAGLQYVRGICEGNGDPDDEHMWLTYSHNKEDIWVASVPVPITTSVHDNIFDDFEDHPEGIGVAGWNVHSPQWAPVRIAEENGNKFLHLQDKDPYDYSKAFRVFPKTEHSAIISFKLRPGQADRGRLEVDVVSANGEVPVRLIFDNGGMISANNGLDFDQVGNYQSGEWVSIEIAVDITQSNYTLSLNGKTISDLDFRIKDCNAMRLEFRTGTYRLDDFSRRPHQASSNGIKTTIPHADEPLPDSFFDIDEVIINSDLN